MLAPLAALINWTCAHTLLGGWVCATALITGGWAASASAAVGCVTKQGRRRARNNQFSG